MQVLNSSDLSANGEILLRGNVDEKEEFLLGNFSNVELHINAPDWEENHDNGLKGTLNVTTQRVVWLSELSLPTTGYGWELKYITLHAISRDLNAFPKACLYCQADLEQMMEIRFVPTNESDLQLMFDVFSRGAELNPDEDSETNENGEINQDGWIYNVEEVEQNVAALDIMQRLDSMLTISPNLHADGQFEDADEDDDLL